MTKTVQQFFNLIGSSRRRSFTVPRSLVLAAADLAADYIRAAADFITSQKALTGEPEKAAAELIKWETRTHSVLVRIERVLDELQTWQNPSSQRSFVSTAAADYEHPNKRTFAAGLVLLAITMKTNKGGKFTLRLPTGFTVLGKAPIAKLKAAPKAK